MVHNLKISFKLNKYRKQLGVINIDYVRRTGVNAYNIWGEVRGSALRTNRLGGMGNKEY